MSAGETAFKLAFQISPIIFTGGIARYINGDMLPIVALTEGPNFVTGLLTGNTETDLDQFFCHFVPMPGSTLIENAIGMYSFANQAIAANAVIVQPRRVSLRMICPVKSTFGYATKLATISALQAAVAQHTNLGGTYTIATPSFLLPNCLLTSLRDISTGETRQVQMAWQWDFIQPLISLQQVQAAESQLMSKLSNGLPTDGSWSGPGTQVGYQLGGAASTTLGASQPLVGTSVSTASAFGAGGVPFGGSAAQAALNAAANQ